MPRDMLTAVAEHWNQSPCGSQHAASAKYSLSYFRQIEEYRYRAEPAGPAVIAYVPAEARRRQRRLAGVLGNLSVRRAMTWDVVTMSLHERHPDLARSEALLCEFADLG